MDFTVLRIVCCRAFVEQGFFDLRNIRNLIMKYATRRIDMATWVVKG